MSRLLARPEFQRWAARSWLTRAVVRREGEAIFDLLSGFAQSQVLAALIKLDVLNRLDVWTSPDTVAAYLDLRPDRADTLLRAGVAIGLIDLRRGRFRVSRRGAVLAAVPGLPEMIAHHDVLYRDLADPVAFFRGEVDTELAGFWPYVFGGNDADAAERYSRLMEDSQALVAEDTLDAVPLDGVRRLMDVGGGTGAFLRAALARHEGIEGVIFDLPSVQAAADRRLARIGWSDRIGFRAGDFRRHPLPEGCDAIALIRVLYDHDDETVRQLLSRAYQALPPGGRLIVSEPMTGGKRPHIAGDVYFALYCMAMRTGRARSPEKISDLLTEAGFVSLRRPAPRRPFVTTAIVARKSPEHV